MGSRLRTAMRSALVFSLLFLPAGAPAEAPGGPEFAPQDEPAFTFGRYLFGDEPTLFAWLEDLNAATGDVLLNGVELGTVEGPFTWCWGDGSCVDGWFPQSHTYADPSRNYVATVVSHYLGGGADSVEIVVRFAAPEINPTPIAPSLAVSIPGSMVALASRMPGYGIPGDLTFFDESYFPLIPRSAAEYVLSVISVLENDLVNGNVCLVEGGFQQVVLRDPTFPGMYSLWYTAPVSFGCGDYGFAGTVAWSSFMHEMGHNFSLNSPADYCLGGKIDGCANAICSETLAQILQHACAFELINGYVDRGLSEDLMYEIRNDAVATIKTVRGFYEGYVDGGMPFATWNDPETPEDETIGTFMTVAYKFFDHAETSGQWYRFPAKRMMDLLQTFDADLRDRYDQGNNAAEADTFRATLMVSALSRGFLEDLREEFRNLNFPISDELYEELMSRPTTAVPRPGEEGVGLSAGPNHPNPFAADTWIGYSNAEEAFIDVRVYDSLGRLVRCVVNESQAPGEHVAHWDGRDERGLRMPPGVYFYEVRAGSRARAGRMTLLR